MTDEEWAGWMRSEWWVLQDPRAGDDDPSPRTWRIVKTEEADRPHPDVLSRYEYEDTARHIARAHNTYLTLLQGAERAALDKMVSPDDIASNTQPPPGRASVP